jgi:anaerobic magnesium-protoporphyrin IX monomethyl ester cyclase
LFSHMKRAGLNKVSFGVESGSQKILDFYGKGTTLKQVENAFEVCRKLRLNTEAYFMLGALPETKADRELTYQFAKKLRPTTSRVFLFMPLPGSELYEYYTEQGYHFTNWKDIHSGKASLPCGDVTQQELEEMREKWIHDFERKTHLVARGVDMMMGIRSLHDAKRAYRKVSRRLKCHA